MDLGDNHIHLMLLLDKQGIDVAIFGRLRTSGFMAVEIDLDDQKITDKAEGVLMTSLLIREWGPDQISIVGENKFEALRKVKYPRHKAAFI